MPGRRLKAGLAACIAGSALTAAVASAGPAIVEVGNLVLRADGGFQPRELPRRQFAATEFSGWASFRAKSGGELPPLQRLVVDFDRDGRVSAGGLPVCDPSLVAASTAAEARRSCAGSQVGRGQLSANVPAGGGTVSTRLPLSFFNGPRVNGRPSLLVHAFATVPAPRAFAILAPIERQRGPFRYRVALDLSALGEFGAITRIEAAAGRRFEAGGKRRSYLSARCGSGVLRTRGRFSFADGTVIDGAVEKACTQR